MRKGQVAAIAFAALASASWWSARVSTASVPAPREEIRPEVPVLPPPPKPKLELSLDDPESVVYGVKPKEEIPIMGEPVRIAPTPTIGLLEPLSRFGVSVDDRRRPIVHYYFAKKSVEGRAVSSHDSRE